MVVTLIAYANAWPDNLTFDDRVFVDVARFAEVGIAGIGHFFTEDLWAASGTDSGLYRPLLLVSIATQTWLFGDWLPGYHLVNIALHTLATVLVCGFVRHVLQAGGYRPRDSAMAALLAATVFGVHPIHAEVVNSIFNGSEIYACIGIVGGLLWFLRILDREPGKAWLGLNLIYLLVLLCRESAASLPVLAVAMILLSRQDAWLARWRRCVPALSLLVPLVLYIALRGHAFEAPADIDEPGATLPRVETPGPGESEAAEATPPLAEQWKDALGHGLRSVSLRPDRLAAAAILWFECWKIVLWPHPLQIHYDDPDTSAWLAIALQLLVFAAALLAGTQSRPALLAGLAFFYLAILPSSQMFGTTVSNPGLADRLLYLPSTGMTIALAAGLAALLQRRGALAAVMPAAVLTMILVPLTWARNAEWASDTRLLESTYRKLESKEDILNSLLAAHLRENAFPRAAEICDEHAASLRSAASWGIHCGSAYGRMDRFDDASEAYLAATRMRESAPFAHANLAMMYLHLGERSAAQEHFEHAIAAEGETFLREYFRALMLIQLHPKDKVKLMEARAHLLRALELQPQHVASRAELEKLDAELKPATGQGRG